MIDGANACKPHNSGAKNKPSLKMAGSLTG
jgi:hypothetical protein